MSDDLVGLTLPGSAQYVGIARMALATFAAAHGFSYDDIEDLRIAVDELRSVALGGAERAPLPEPISPLQLRFAFDAGALTLSVAGGSRQRCVTPFAELILKAVAEEYDLGTTDGCEITCRTRSRRLGDG